MEPGLISSPRPFAGFDPRYWKLPARTIATENSWCCSAKDRSLGPDVQMMSWTVQPSPCASVRAASPPGVPSASLCAHARCISTAIFVKKTSSYTHITKLEVQGIYEPAKKRLGGIPQ